MKKLAPRIGSAIALITLLTVHTTLAAYIIEASNVAGSLGEGNFAYTGPGGTVASSSTASAGQLPSTTDLPPTFFSLNHVFGGNGITDEYTFTYSPLSDGDNTGFAENTVFNLPQNLRSTGLLSSGDAGTYNVFRIHPATPGVSGSNTTYNVSVNGDLKVTDVINQNAANLPTGENIGRWELLGSVDLLNAADTVTVTMTPEISSFVSMRASGIMFEYVAAIPEPSVVALLGISSVLIWVRRRLMI